MTGELDVVALYGKSVGLDFGPRTVLVEGTTDVDLFLLAARLERERSGIDLLARLAIVPGGIGDDGGTKGVNRRLHLLRGCAKNLLDPGGKARYRFVALFDNDKAGRQAVSDARYQDTSIQEYKDVFRLHPIMPRPAGLDPVSLRTAFEQANGSYKGLDWELEDLLPCDLLEAFECDNPGAVLHTSTVNERVHRDFTRDGKARLHRFVRENAIHADLAGVLTVLTSMRLYLGLK